MNDDRMISLSHWPSDRRSSIMHVIPIPSAVQITARPEPPATRPAAGSISDRRAVSVSPKNGVALAVLPLARAVLLIRDIAPMNEYRLGQRLDPSDLSADGRAELGFTPFYRQPWRADSKRRAVRDAPRHA
jgi:hypothetical protein